tara:strand:+ start:587 stop:817 length:231 start_codon:yes stop_codon:yes gene_type:complete
MRRHGNRADTANSHFDSIKTPRAASPYPSHPQQPECDRFALPMPVFAPHALLTANPATAKYHATPQATARTLPQKP